MSASFRTYPKIHRLGADENVGILDGFVYVQEKLDGANTSIWYNADLGAIQMGSRNQLLQPGTDFRGFCDYVQNHTGIQTCLATNPTYRLYGEWLVHHTVVYNAPAYNHFYLFDVLEADQNWLNTPDVYTLASTYDIKTPTLFMSGENLTADTIVACVGQSSVAPAGEGVVIKNPDFRNSFGDNAMAKLVSEKFKEDHGSTFNCSAKRGTDAYVEAKLVDKYIPYTRLLKVVNKLENLLDRALNITDTARVIGTVYHDFITEECWNIAKLKQIVNFRTLESLAARKVSKLYQDLLAGLAPAAI